MEYENSNDEPNGLQSLGSQTCSICGKEAREPVASLDIGIQYPRGEKRWIRLGEDDFEEGAFCQDHFVSFIALKVDAFRGSKSRA